MRRLTDTEKDRLFRLYAEGEPIIAIARALGIQASNVRHWLANPPAHIPMADIEAMRAGQLAMKDVSGAAERLRKGLPGSEQIVAGLKAMIRLYEQGFMRAGERGKYGTG